MPQAPSDLHKFSTLLEVVKILRGPDGCPWDKEQTHRTLTQYAIEETFELCEAIDSDNTPEIISELGDLLLQVVLHAEIGRQAGQFEMSDVVRSINEKMIRRHPHVFADTVVKDSTEVLANWSKIKSQEKLAAGSPSHAKANFEVPSGLPSLLRAQKIGKKTKDYAFDWTSSHEVLTKVHEELNELEAEVSSQDADRIREELGDVLFSVAQLARHLGEDAEQCLRLANNKFEQRFFSMLQMNNLNLDDFSRLSTEEKEDLWAKVKRLS